MGSASGGGGWDPGPPQPQNPGALDAFQDETNMLIIKDTNAELKKSRPRDIYININQVIPNLQYCKKLKSGDFLIKINKRDKVETLKITKIGQIPVKIEEPGYMNQTKVTIYNKDLVQYTDDELIGDLKAKNKDVISAKIQTVYKNNAQINSEFAIVTLDGKFSELELKNKRLKLHWESLTVKLYIPPPTRCKNCWAFDHFSSKNKPCTRPSICGHCSKDFHLQKEGNKIIGKCEREMLCLNCKSHNHPTWSKECSRYKDEQAIWEKSTRDRISYSAAKHILDTQYNNRIKTYAASATKVRDSTTTSEDVHNDYQKTNKLVIALTKQVQKLTNIIIQNLPSAYTNEDTEYDEDSEDMQTGGCSTSRPGKRRYSDSAGSPLLPSPQEGYMTVAYDDNGHRKVEYDPLARGGGPQLPQRGNNNPQAQYKRANQRRNT